MRFLVFLLKNYSVKAPKETSIAGVHCYLYWFAKICVCESKSNADLPQVCYRRARNNGRSTDNVRTDCGFDRSNFRLAGHVDRSK